MIQVIPFLNPSSKEISRDDAKERFSQDLQKQIDDFEKRYGYRFFVKFGFESEEKENGVKLLYGGNK